MSDGTRLNKYIAQAGVASRRRADELIAYGKVRINGKVVRALGTIVAPGDRVDVSGTPIAPIADKAYLVVHKPAGVLTTLRDPQGRRTVSELLPKRAPRVVPVGRLDYDTAGVLLMTNDGELANRLLHPRYGVEKIYRATIAGRLSTEEVKRLNDGVLLDGGEQASGAKLRVVSVRAGSSVIDITVHEGRNRQVRRMFEAVGHPVQALVRLRFGPIALGDLPIGHSRALTPKELSALRRVASQDEKHSST
ncbi:MAG TPA: pseudouridine synthase [Verrucomicrobiae bacterium]|nr:pseudouridine synthase [Verrucomicrobiae bacterium]